MKRRLFSCILFAALCTICLFAPGHAQTPPQHFVQLTFTNSTSQPPSTCTTACTFSYNIYRGTTTGGPYTKIANLAPNLAATTQSFNDTTATAGVKVFYVVTAVDSTGVESVFSNEASAIPLGPPAAPAGLGAVAK